jgi:hypothetical protein
MYCRRRCLGIFLNLCLRREHKRLYGTTRPNSRASKRAAPRAALVRLPLMDSASFLI